MKQYWEKFLAGFVLENKIHIKNFIISTLNEFFPNPKPSLTEWKTPFQLLVAILLSGNSTDKAVNSVTPKLFASAPDAQALSRLPLEELYLIILPCGLGKRKAEYLHNLSKILLEKYRGEPPASLELLTKLPGVGRKTASVFLGIIYDIPTFPVDTHILRLSQRWGISNKRSPSAAEKDLVLFFGNMNSPKLHLQLIYYARNYCPALYHDVNKCRICWHLSNSCKKNVKPLKK
ncbi:UV-endonuclease,endonuclease III,3-methyladenine DNA glycosylase/8-oxoguanine DNA glycosylase,endonuclease III,HhH-GPD superfamily base excision DNA repair protein [Chlamydia poikilotherma]|uniref:Endonuclease III n=1 Tax=Chlamydia poikilotherma TaxID=1967783 RepID=A0A3B0PT86_9CHLA|nr:UV-endonuclease,endonuclease III,3-methyladenine DNA glycosylase/8-oxoguanine DNA glycosylase,endonuclease III,HhH-GPD superfamily base excision DNA repair protein [Chlamydia poikilotherma]